MDASCAFLALFQSSDRKFYLASQNLSLQHFWCEMPEIVFADQLKWNNCLAVVLRHQNEGCVHSEYLSWTRRAFGLTARCSWPDIL
ncbi:hypothetical protein EMIT051CA3_11331 [Pseudomonas chlororaphis]